MNPYVLLVLLLTVGAMTGGAYYQGRTDGENKSAAEQAKLDKAIQETREAAIKGAADAIANIKITSTTIRQNVETVTREVPVYRDCRNDRRVLDDLNGALRGEPAGEGKLPEGPGQAPR